VQSFQDSILNAWHLGRGRRPDLPDKCILGIISAHALSSSPQVIEVGKACDRYTQRHSAWNRRSRPRDAKVCDLLYFFHLRLIDVNEGTVHMPHNQLGQPAAAHCITSLVPRRTIYSIWTLVIHARWSHCDPPRRLLNVSGSVRSRLGKPESGSVVSPRL
jgi:hypothetical protein